MADDGCGRNRSFRAFSFPHCQPSPSHSHSLSHSHSPSLSLFLPPSLSIVILPSLSFSYNPLSVPSRRAHPKTTAGTSLQLLDNLLPFFLTYPYLLSLPLLSHSFSLFFLYLSHSLCPLMSLVLAIYLSVNFFLFPLDFLS